MRPHRESQRDRLARERQEEIAYVLASEAGRRFAYRLGTIAPSTMTAPSQALLAEGRSSVVTELLAAVLTRGRPAGAGAAARGGPRRGPGRGSRRPAR